MSSSARTRRDCGIVTVGRRVWRQQTNSVHLARLLRLGGEQDREAESENDREPDQPHGPARAGLWGEYPHPGASPERPRRMVASSSMTATITCPRSCRALAHCRKREVEGCSYERIVHGPDESAVSLDDGLGDRQAHSHPRGLRGVERLED